MTEDRSRALDLKAAWRAQPREIEPMALEKVRTGARKAQRRLRRAMIIEFAASAVVVALTVLLMLRGSELYQRAAGVLTLIWVAFYLWRWIRAFGPRRLPDDALACLDFHRGQLMQMRREILRSWRWVFAPVFGLCVLTVVGRWTSPAAAGRTVWFDHIIICVGAALIVETMVLMWLWMLNRADKLQDRIDDLDALTGETPQ